MEWVASVNFLSGAKGTFSLDRVVRLYSVHTLVILALLELGQDRVWLVLSFILGKFCSIIHQWHEFVFNQVRYVFLHRGTFRNLCSRCLSSFRPNTTLTKAIILNPKGIVALDYLGCISSNRSPICPEIIRRRKLPCDGIRGGSLDKRTIVCRSRCHQRRELLLSKRLWRVFYS